MACTLSQLVLPCFVTRNFAVDFCLLFRPSKNISLFASQWDYETAAENPYHITCRRSRKKSLPQAAIVGSKSSDHYLAPAIFNFSRFCSLRDGFIGTKNVKRDEPRYSERDNSITKPESLSSICDSLGTGQRLCNNIHICRTTTNKPESY